MLRYKFKHLEKHHRKELNEKIYRASRNYDTIGELCETIDAIIDIYLANGDDASDELALPIHDVSQQRELLNDFLVKLRRLLNFTHNRPLPKYVEFYLKGIL